MILPWASQRKEQAGAPRALVYGLGLSGLSAARFLRRRGVEVWGFDQRQASALALGDLAQDPAFHAILGGEPNSLPADLEWSRVDLLVKSPGVPASRPLLDQARVNGVPVIGEIELALPFLQGPLVGITGSNGKSTTTAMTGAILQAAGFDARVCGNIGTPLCDEIDRPQEAGSTIYVVELSSFQLEDCPSLRPVAATLLNLSPDHLDRHGTIEAYLAAKWRIFAQQGPREVAILNADDEPLVQALPSMAGLASRQRRFSRRGPVEDGCWLEGGTVVERGPGSPSQPLFRVEDVPVAGGHNLENAMAAALLARAVGVEPERIAAGLRGFRGLPHRIEKVREWGGVVWYDDSKGTNPASTLGALDGFPPGQLLLILGGLFKGGDLTPLTQRVAERVRRTYLIGSAEEVFAAALEVAGAPFVRCQTLAAAVDAAAREARPGDAVLLSPACASFDQFRNYVDRGETFQRLVAALPAPGGGHGA